MFKPIGQGLIPRVRVMLLLCKLCVMLVVCKLAQSASTLKVQPQPVSTPLNHREQGKDIEDFEDKENKIKLKLLKEEHDALSLLPDMDTNPDKEESMENMSEILKQNKDQEVTQHLRHAHERTVKAVKLAKALKALESLEKKRKQASDGINTQHIREDSFLREANEDSINDELDMDEMEPEDEDDGLNYRVIEKHSGYEERLYFGHRTVCFTYNEPDPFPSASEKPDDWDTRQGLKSNQLDKLQDYLTGSNQQKASVVLEWPISVEVTPLDNNTMTRKMCVWISLNKNVPQPNDPQLEVEMVMDPIITYSRRFIGRVNELKYRMETKTLLEKIMADGLGVTADFNQYFIKIYDDGIQERENVVSFKKEAEVYHEAGDIQNAVTDKIDTTDFEVDFGAVKEPKIEERPLEEIDEKEMRGKGSMN